jgi:hypothetical protein
MIATAAAAATVIEAATAGTATAIATYDVTVREIRAGTAARAAIIRARRIAPVNPSATRAGEARLLPRTSPRARSNRHARTNRHDKTSRGKTRHLARKEHPGPTNRRAQTNLAAKASDLPMSAASAVSEEDAAGVDAAAAGVTAAKTMPMVPAMPVPAIPRARAMGIREASALPRRLSVSEQRLSRRPSSPHANARPLRQHPSRRRSTAIRLPLRHRRRPAASTRRLRAQERTTNMSCGPLPRAMFSVPGPTNGNAGRAAVPATRD